MVGVVLGGCWIKVTSKYKCTILTLCFGFLAALILFNYLLALNNIYVLLISGSALGLFLAPSLTLGIDLSCQLGYPVGESYSNGLI